jgi:histidine triad (HIT) family protein
MNCVFCQIVSGKIAATIVKSGDYYLAFRDINPQAPTHILVIPRQHYSCLADVRNAEILGSLFHAAADIASELNLDGGFRLVVNTGAQAGQSVFHLHIHLLGGRTMHWPPG